MGKWKSHFHTQNKLFETSILCIGVFFWFKKQVNTRLEVSLSIILNPRFRKYESRFYFI
jgi:hypothetical protein